MRTGDRRSGWKKRSEASLAGPVVPPMLEVNDIVDVPSLSKFPQTGDASSAAPRQGDKCFHFGNRICAVSTRCACVNDRSVEAVVVVVVVNDAKSRLEVRDEQ